MHVGYTLGFQNPGNARTDAEVYADDLALLDVAVEGGFDSVWVVEHHFTDYFMSPDPVQFLTWAAAKYPHIRVGTGVIVLPWHEPVRCAEQIALLDNLSDGRLILGIGRGLGKIEFDGFRIPMDTSRERFVDYATMILAGLESGTIQSDSEFATVPARDIRPKPRFSFKGRTYAASMSPEAMPIMAKLGVGVIVVPQKPWHVVAEDLNVYRQTWTETHGVDSLPPAPLISGNMILDGDPTRAEELAYRYIGGYYDTIIKHYGFASRDHVGIKGYEFYAGIGDYVDKRGREGAIGDYVRLMPWGTPDQVLEKLSILRDQLGVAAINPSFSYADMPFDVAKNSLNLFITEVLPVIKQWEAEDIPSGTAPAPALV